MLLVPALNTRIPIIMLMDTLLPLRPPDPIRLAISQNANHLLGHWQVRINRRGKRVD